ncbi:MAG: ATP-binding cassette domain-containing protein, partial [Lachnospiraceae bacterium]|nr:ATP-binding cassette domain-containing protein [Lachnospiraceae bacterium]
NIKVYNRRDYYKLISGVFQDFSVVAATVAVNVAQDAFQIDMERVQDCVGKAGLKKKIETLPQKYGTLLDRDVHIKAVELSGGELQRLMIARLLYKDSPIIVLDEPTAALDPIAENDIYQKYNELTKGKSAVFISHRLASTRFCDRILLIEDGKIAEEGTHEELLGNGKRYTELFEMQSRYYQEGELV